MGGTLVNVAGILVGSLIGLALKRGIPPRVNDALLKAEGLAIILIGLAGALKEMLSVAGDDGRLSDSGGLALLVSLVIGCVAGEWLRIDDRINGAAARLERRFRADGFAKGFVSASLVFCVGAMAIVGPVQEGMTGKADILHIKTMLDFTTAIVLASTLGWGVAFAALPVLVVQAVPALLAARLSAHITPELLSPFCMVGYALVAAIGVNFLLDAKIKVANLLPALLAPGALHFLSAWAEFLK